MPRDRFAVRLCYRWDGVFLKPHLAHIQNTLVKKQLAEEAADRNTSYRRYMHMIEAARRNGYSEERIVAELEAEKERILKDQREGDDPLFQQGVHNAKVACLSSIELILSELKGDDNGKLHR